ncbi:uncharacterized protein [Arachis hypogaea]|uniref:uncharacterized protein n=1 Tax=Arachis hypogaea TaxID=3818 RepID=UPI003B222594
MPGAFGELGAAASEDGVERTGPYEDRATAAVSRAVHRVERRSGDGCWVIEYGVTRREGRHTGQGRVAKATVIVDQAENVPISPSAETAFAGDGADNVARRRKCTVGVGGGRLAVHGREVDDLLRAAGAADNAEKGSSEVDVDNGKDDQECDKSGLGTKAGTARNLPMLEAGHREDEEDVEHGKDDEASDNEDMTLEEQLSKNKRTWEVATESGAVLYNEEDDIMAILQQQNEEIALKKRLAKQRAKARRNRPKTHKKAMQVEMLPEDIASYSFTKTVWKGLVPPRVELFVWFVLIRRVNTKERLSRLGVVNQEDVTCVLCNQGVEYGHHLFLGCEFSWQVWCA